MDKKIQVNINDYYSECINDKINTIKKINNLPHGTVEIYEISDDKNKKKLYTSDNLVLNIGREWITQRLFNINNSFSTSGKKDYYISWFGLGDGGTPTDDPLTPIAPTSTDVGLNNDIMISSSDSTCGDYRVSPVSGYYKIPIDSDNIEFEQDLSNDNAYIIVKNTITVTSSYANGYNISEAGLFVATSRNGPFKIYARTTFPSIVKTSDRILTFIWRVYC